MTVRARQAAGRRVHCPGGYSAFVPEPLPPELHWSSGLATAVSEADRAIGRLAGEGRRLTEARLLSRPFVKREAVFSTHIDGGTVTLAEFLAAEAGAAVDRSRDDLRNVANYVSALEYGVRRLKKLPLSLRLVGELHERLMKGANAVTVAPGRFRRSQNWIGRPGDPIANAIYVPPPPEYLAQCLGAWETFLQQTSLPPLVQIALVHSQFEVIHPFLTGNGRVGRLVVTLFLLERGILPAPLLYLSAFLAESRDDYYGCLLGVTERGEWEEWLEYFLRGVARQAEDAADRARRIDRLLTTWRQLPVGRSANSVNAVIDLLADNPFCTISETRRKLNVGFTTAQRAINRLTSASAVVQVSGGRRNRAYCARPLLDILEEPG